MIMTMGLIWTRNWLINNSDVYCDYLSRSKTLFHDRKKSKVLTDTGRVKKHSYYFMFEKTSEDDLHELLDWVYGENQFDGEIAVFPGEHYSDHVSVSFSEKTDAMVFKMRWGIDPEVWY